MSPVPAGDALVSKGCDGMAETGPEKNTRVAAMMVLSDPSAVSLHRANSRSDWATASLPWRHVAPHPRCGRHARARSGRPGCALRRGG